MQQDIPENDPLKVFISKCEIHVGKNIILRISTELNSKGFLCIIPDRAPEHSS